MTTTIARVAVSLAVLAMASGLEGCTASPEEASPSTDTAQVTARLAGKIVQSPIPQGPASEDASDQLVALTDFVSSLQSLIPQLMDQGNGVYSEIQINAVDSDTLEYAYFYADQIDASRASDYFDEALSTFQSLVDKAVVPGMKLSGITVDPKVRYTYYNADGTLIWSHTFAES